MPFELAKSYSSAHLIPSTADLALDPPESYFYVQDFLIISCGVLYAICYVSYICRTWSDRYLAGTVYFLSLTMSWELYYAFVTTTTPFERVCFLMWFLVDAMFAGVALFRAEQYRGRKGEVARNLALGVAAGVAAYAKMGGLWPDEREQVTAYWTGLVLQFPIGWGTLGLLMRGETRGQSLEIWLTKYLGCWTAYGVFGWRYVNVPQNWAYVGSWLSLGIIALTMLPETIYPFVYIRMRRKHDKVEYDNEKR